MPCNRRRPHVITQRFSSETSGSSFGFVHAYTVCTWRLEKAVLLCKYLNSMKWTNYLIIQAITISFTRSCIVTPHLTPHSLHITEGVYMYTWNAFWKFTYCSDTNFVMKMTAIWMHFTSDDQSNRAEEISRSIRACAHGRTHRMHTKRYSWAWCSEANVQRNLSEREWERSDYEGCSIGNP